MPEPAAERTPVPEQVALQPSPAPEEVAQQPSRRAGDASPLDLEHAVGVGVDVVGITAFAAQLDEPGTRFARVFTPAERRTTGGEPQRLAARWAAKEAVVKAWSSTCFGHPEVIDPDHVDLREIEVRTDAWGRPEVRLHGEIGRCMSGYTVLLSLSHDPDADVAMAFVVLREA